MKIQFKFGNFDSSPWQQLVLYVTALVLHFMMGHFRGHHPRGTHTSTTKICPCGYFISYEPFWRIGITHWLSILLDPLGTDMGKLHLKYILDGLEKAATVSASKSYTTVFQTVFWEVLVYL